MGPASSHSLHDDLGLHSFSKMVAELSDGRHAAIEIDDAGHITIVAVWVAGEAASPATYPQQVIMREQADRQRELKPKDDEQLDKAQPFKLDSNLQKMVGAAANAADRAERKKKKQKQKQQPAPAPVVPPSTSPLPSTTPRAFSLYVPIGNPGDPSYMQQVTSNSAMSNGFLQAIGAGGTNPMSPQAPGTVTTMPRDPVFLARLESIMNDNQFDRRLKGRTRGKLDMTRLYKASTGATGVFTQKSLRRNKRYNVALVIDESSSMNASTSLRDPNGVWITNKDLAGELAQFLAQHLDKIPGVEIMITGFSGGVHQHKNFGQAKDLGTIKSEIVASGGGGTDDAPALEFAYTALKQQATGQNILLYLTDGEPNSRVASTRIFNRNAHIGTTVGIGINHSVPYVKHNFRVASATELKPKIIKLLEREITRR